MLRSVSIIGGVLAFIVALALALHVTLSDLTRTANLAGIVQSFATAFVLIAGGAFAGYRLHQFRDFKPHVTINQTVSHRAISENYVHLIVTATLTNSSRVKLEFHEAYFRLQILSPISDREVENLYAKVFADENGESPWNLQWPTMEEASRRWVKGELVVEPGERHQETCEFVISNDVSSILVYTYFYNPGRGAIPQGWGTTTVCDIIP